VGGVEGHTKADGDSIFGLVWLLWKVEWDGAVQDKPMRVTDTVVFHYHGQYLSLTSSNLSFFVGPYVDDLVALSQPIVNLHVHKHFCLVFPS
jgi:hypothetical protein